MPRNTPLFAAALSILSTTAVFATAIVLSNPAILA